MARSPGASPSTPRRLCCRASRRDGNLRSERERRAGALWPAQPRQEPVTMRRHPPRSLFAVVLVAAGLIAALPARAETLADALISAYRNSNLLEQNRAVLRAADEDVASAVSNLRPVLQW